MSVALEVQVVMFS